MAGEKITIDISILKGIFGDLTRLQQQLAGVSGGAIAMDGAAASAIADLQRNVQAVTGAVGGMEGAFDASMRGVVGDLMAPLQKTQELEAKLRSLGEQVRTAKSVGEITKLKKEIAATQRELDGVNPSAMEQKVGGAAARMRGFFGGLVAPVAGAFAVGGVAAFGRGVFDAAAAAQSFDTSMRVMLRSKERADALTAQVTEFAASTPFELGQLREATTQLLAYQVSADEIIPTLTNLGNIAAGVGMNKLPQLMTAFGQVKAAGKLTGGELRQFTEAGVPLLDELAKVTGMSVKDMAGNIGNLDIPFSQVQQALAGLATGTGPFANLMELQAKTLGGRLSNLSDAWDKFKTKMGEKLEPMFSAGLQMASGWLERLNKAFDWVLANGEAIRSAIEVVGIAVGTYTLALMANNRQLIWNRILQGQAGAAAKMKALWVGLTTGAVRGATSAQWSWNAALTANPIGIVIVAIGALVAAVVYAWRNCDGFRNAVLQLWAKVRPVFEDLQRIGEQVFGAVMDILGELWALVGEAFGSMMESMRELWNSSETLRDVVKGVFEVLKFTTTAVWRVIAVVLRAFAEALAWVAEHSEGLRRVIMGMWYSIKEGFTIGWEVVRDVFGAIVDAAQGAGKVLEGVFTFDWDLIKEGAAQQIDVLKRSFNGILDTPDKFVEAGQRMGAAYAAGAEKGSAGFRASMERRAQAKLNALDVAPKEKPGENVGAASLLGAAGGAADGKGVTVGGSEGSGRSITMNIKMSNVFNLPRDGNMGARDAADRVVAAIVNKLNDAQYAMG